MFFMVIFGFWEFEKYEDYRIESVGLLVIYIFDNVKNDFLYQILIIYRV